MSKTTLVTPNSSNPCAGAFPGHLDVMFTNKCNAKCAWCIEKNGWHPTERMSAAKLAAKAVSLNPTQVNILGGEPTQEYAELYTFIQQVRRFSPAKISITSNVTNLPTLLGVGADYYNLSIHHYDPRHDGRIKGLANPLFHVGPNDVATFIRRVGAGRVRFNCTVHSDGIHTKAGIDRYVQWATGLGVKHIRFAELQCCTKDEGYISLRDLMGQSIPADPFTEGCCTEVGYGGVTIQYRTSCGIVCPAKSLPGGGQYSQPGGTLGVLYYDGSHFPTWQKEGETMNQSELINLLQLVKDGDVTVTGAAKILAGAQQTEASSIENAGNCPPRRRAERAEASCHVGGCHGRRGGC